MFQAPSTLPREREGVVYLCIYSLLFYKPTRSGGERNSCLDKKTPHNSLASISVYYFLKYGRPALIEPLCVTASYERCRPALKIKDPLRLSQDPLQLSLLRERGSYLRSTNEESKTLSDSPCLGRGKKEEVPCGMSFVSVWSPF